MLQEKLNELKPFKECKETEEYLKITMGGYSGRGEVHHILPEKLYPEYSNSKWNVVNLSYEDHYRVHELLPFMLEGKSRGSMLYAWNMMCGRTQGEFIDKSKYAELRKMHSERVSQQMQENQPMHRPEVVAKFIGKKRPEHALLMSGKNNPACRDEVRKILSENNPMKLEENKAKFRGANNHNYGKHISDKHKEQLRVARTGSTVSEEVKAKIAVSATGKTVTAVEIDGIVYSSVSEAARVYGVNRHTIPRWVKSGKAKKLTKQAKPITIEGVVYESMSEAANSLDITLATIRSMIKHNEASVTS